MDVVAGCERAFFADDQRLDSALGDRFALGFTAPRGLLGATPPPARGLLYNRPDVLPLRCSQSCGPLFGRVGLGRLSRGAEVDRRHILLIHPRLSIGRHQGSPPHEPPAVDRPDRDLCDLYREPHRKVLASMRCPPSRPRHRTVTTPSVGTVPGSVDSSLVRPPLERWASCPSRSRRSSVVPSLPWPARKRLDQGQGASRQSGCGESAPGDDEGVEDHGV